MVPKCLKSLLVAAFSFFCVAIGGKAFGQGIILNEGLSHLNLARNQIGDSGARALSEAVLTNKTLEELDLCRNLFSDSAKKFIKQSLLQYGLFIRVILE